MKKRVIWTMVMACLLVVTSACGSKNKKTEEENKKTEENVIANTNADVINEVIIDGFKISNVSLISKNGAAVFSATITNTNESALYVRAISILLKDENGNEVTTLPGFVGSTLEPNGSYTVTTNKYMDITPVASIEYAIIR